MNEAELEALLKKINITLPNDKDKNDDSEDDNNKNSAENDLNKDENTT